MDQRQDPRSLSGHQRLVPRRGRPAAAPKPVADPRLATQPSAPDPRLAKAGQRAALVMAGVGVFWIVATWAGGALGWTTRARALFDLIALAGFAFALYLTWQVWRLRRAEKG